MALVWTQHIPKGILLNRIERQNDDHLGGPPPIYIIQEVTKVDESKVETVTIKLNGGTKHLLQKFVGGTAEECVRFIRSFWNVELKLKYRKDWAFTKKVKSAQKTTLCGLDQNDANDSTCKDESKRKFLSVPQR